MCVLRSGNGFERQDKVWWNGRERQGTIRAQHAELPATSRTEGSEAQENERPECSKTISVSWTGILFGTLFAKPGWLRLDSSHNSFIVLIGWRLTLMVNRDWILRFSSLLGWGRWFLSKCLWILGGNDQVDIYYWVANPSIWMYYLLDPGTNRVSFVYMYKIIIITKHSIHTSDHL